MAINKSLVYDVQPARFACNEAYAELSAAQARVETVNTGYRNAVARTVGVAATELEFSNCACIATGIAYHVYRAHECVFCGCRNDDIFLKEIPCSTIYLTPRCR